VDDFIKISGDAADAIDALGGAANAAVSGLLNVPNGFKIALNLFNSTLDRDMNPRIKDITSTGPTIETRPLFDSTRANILGSDGSALPLNAALPPLVIEGDVVIQVDGTGAARETARAVVEKLRTIPRGQFWVTSGFGRLR
jgi:hypothetical protein